MRIRIEMNIQQDNYCGQEEIIAAIKRAYEEMAYQRTIIAQAPPDPNGGIPLPTDICIDRGEIKVEAV